MSSCIEDFIDLLNNYESEKQLFQLHDAHGFPWWDLVRYKVRFALCVERGLYGHTYASSLSKIERAQSFARQARRFFYDTSLLRSNSKVKPCVLIVSQRSLNYICKAAEVEIRRGNVILLVNKDGYTTAPNKAIRSQSLQFFTRLAKQAQYFPPCIKKEARGIAEEIRIRFYSTVDVYSLIVSKYREEMAARCAWSYILDHASSLERLVYVNDDTRKSLVFLARARGIYTEEVQHAYMGRAHIGFSYPPLEHGLATLPDKLIVTRDSGDITYPVKRVFVQEDSIQRAVVPRDIDVLVGSSPTLSRETTEIVAALCRLGIRLAVKLHPAETKETSECASRLSVEEAVIYAGEENFCDLAWRARIYIPVNATSTTAFEAAEMGARVVLVDIDGVKKTSISDRVASARANSLEALPWVVRSQIIASEAEVGRLPGDEK